MKKILLFTLLPALAFGQAKISELDALTAGADADEVAIVDKSDTTQAASGSTKKITLANILAWLDDKDVTWTGTNTFASVVATAANVTSLVFEGATADDNETTLAVTDPTADRTVTLPDATGTVALVAGDVGAATATTPSAGDSDTSVATTAFVTEGKIQKAFIEKHAASHTLTAAECYGAVYYATAAATLTLPAAADGMSLTVIATGAFAVSVDADAADLIILDGTALDDGDKITSGSTAGEIAVLTYYDATGWYAATDGWSDGGP